MNRKTFTAEVDSNLSDLSAAAVERYRRVVRNRYPRASWVAGRDFSRIVAGDALLSLRFSMIDPQAEVMAWRDAAQRLGVHSDDGA